MSPAPRPRVVDFYSPASPLPPAGGIGLLGTTLVTLASSGNVLSISGAASVTDTLTIGNNAVITMDTKTTTLSGESGSAKASGLGGVGIREMEGRRGVEG